jgi:hypothetical protein
MNTYLQFMFYNIANIQNNNFIFAKKTICPKKF